MNENIIKKPPVVSVMGHIDHGKSTMLSFIRQNKKPLNEAGGITQHVKAYEVIHKNKEQELEKITFIDTPGHEAFVNTRKRGAKVADIAILVVSAEDGVKPQTLEALKAINESKTPYIVAITKIDKPSANIEKTKMSLAENGIFVEGYGGTISAIPVSSKTGEGIDNLLEMILLIRDLENLTGDKSISGEGVIIESNQDNKKGIVASCIIKNGSIKTGDFIKSGNSIGKIKIIEDENGKRINEASFSSPVSIIGWEEIPEVGNTFKVFESKESMLIHKDEEKNNIQNDKLINAKYYLPVILKADTLGGLEALIYEISKLNSEEISLKIISKGAGTINESDIKMADGREKSIVLGFNVKIDTQAKTLSERNNIEVVVFDIIYKLSDWLKIKMEESKPKEVNTTNGEAKILKTFSKSKDKQIVGGKVEKGTIINNTQVKILRRDQEIGLGRIKSLQSGKTSTEKINDGSEFGSMIESKIEIMQNDKIISFN